MAGLSIENLSKSFPTGRGTPVTALHNLSLTAAPGELLAIVGPSGCGKTTLLRLIAGLETPDSGSILLDDERLDPLPPERRDVAMVFQNHALYPHLTVRENLASGLKWRNVPRVEAADRVDAIARSLKLDHCLDRLPESLSGGERQRVALGRSAVLHPRLFLLDEPLAHLDAGLRGALKTEIRNLNRASGTTLIHVTHDQAEALSLGDRIAVMNAGAIQQIGRPEEIYQQPANLFVARFIGTRPMNLLAGELAAEGDKVVFKGSIGNATATLPVPATKASLEHLAKPVILGLRPERLALSPADEQSAPASPGSFKDIVRFVEFAGDACFVTLESGMTAKIVVGEIFAEGFPVQVKADMEQAALFDPATEAAIR